MKILSKFRVALLMHRWCAFDLTSAAGPESHDRSTYLNLDMKILQIDRMFQDQRRSRMSPPALHGTSAWHQIPLRTWCRSGVTAECQCQCQQARARAVASPRQRVAVAASTVTSLEHSALGSGNMLIRQLQENKERARRCWHPLWCADPSTFLGSCG